MPLAFGHAFATEDWTSSGAGKTLAESLGMEEPWNRFPTVFCSKETVGKDGFYTGFTRLCEDYKILAINKRSLLNNQD